MYACRQHKGKQADLPKTDSLVCTTFSIKAAVTSRVSDHPLVFLSDLPTETK